MTASSNFESESPDLTLIAKHYLGHSLWTQVFDHFTNDLKWTPEITKERLTETVRYLYLTSCDPTCSKQKFFPLTKEVDEIWHYLIIQTREYSEFCYALPGKTFLHHQSIPFARYTQTYSRSRNDVIRDFLEWIPIYRKHFGPYTHASAKHWKIIELLKSAAQLSLDDINRIGMDSVSIAESSSPWIEHPMSHV